MTGWIIALCLGATAAVAQTPTNNAPQVPASTGAAEATSHLEGPKVTSTRIVDEGGEVLEENPSGLPLQAGQALQSVTVRESLKLLFRTGRYADIRAEAAPEPSGLRLDFVVKRNFYINIVHADGLREPPNEGVALAALQLGPGQIFRETELQEAIARLRDTLRENGFYESRLSRELSPVPATRQMDVRVKVEPGPRARVASVEVRSTAGTLPPNLVARTRLKAGREISAARLERATERVRSFLAKHGHLGARVTLRRGDYDAKSNTLPIVLEVGAGPKVRVEVTGAKISGRKLRKLLPIYQEGALDEDLLQEGRRNIRDYLEGEGYFDSQVRYTTGEDPKRGENVITYSVERGKRRRLVGLDFSGNRYFDAELLRSRLQMQPAGFVSHGRFSHKLLDADTESIRQLYIANGFREVKVQGELEEKHQSKESDLFVHFRIAEGAQTRVASLKLEGNQKLSSDTLLAAVGSTPGQPYSEFNVAGDRDNILAIYFNEGFPEARFESVETPAEVPNRVRLVYRITEGPQFRVRGVLLGGFEHTRKELVAREVLMKPGEPLREGEIVETQRRLYNLGIFSRAQIATQNPAGTDTDKTLLVLVEEAKRYTIAYGGGIEVQRLGSSTDPAGTEVRASPRGILEVSRANFLGRAHTVSFKIRASTLQGRALLSYSTPNFTGRKSLSLLVTGFADKTRDVRTFTSTRYEASVQLAQQLTPITSLLYRYSFRRVLVDAKSLHVDPNQIPLFSQPTKISAFGISWIRERRDNPADATRGSFNTVDFSVAEKKLGSSASFLRLFLQNSTFLPLPRKLVFARSTRLGLQHPIGDTQPIDIPLPERFFAGGGNSLRGFSLNQAGPRDAKTGFPIGGQAMLLFNQELRFPMRLPYVGGSVGGAVFYDAGNVFSRVGRITLMSKPPSPADLNYFSHTIGLSFRYGTPVGPVRLDLGYLLNPARFCVPSTVTDPACPAGNGTTRTSRFQFFFNIGSLF